MTLADSDDTIRLAHGGGGQLSEELLARTILPRVAPQAVGQPLPDAARLVLGDQTLCLTTDSYVVQPLIFPGGNIGTLAVCGTVNDLAVSGAVPQFLSLGLIIEEGFSCETLEVILDSVGRAAETCGVRIVTGDTKTVERGAADGLFINTAGVGRLHPRARDLAITAIRPGDRVLVSGTLGDHGLTLMSLRSDIHFESRLQSDCAALNGLIQGLLDEVEGIRFMRDPTRGGLAVTLNEVARATGCDVVIRQEDLPVRPEVQAAADMLGLDVLNIANEGKVVVVVAAEQADRCLECCRRHPLGRGARLIGDIVADRPGQTSVVRLETRIGGQRIVPMPYGRDLPRIC